MLAQTKYHGIINVPISQEPFARRSRTICRISISFRVRVSSKLRWLKISGSVWGLGGPGPTKGADDRLVVFKSEIVSLVICDPGSIPIAPSIGDGSSSQRGLVLRSKPSR